MKNKYYTNGLRPVVVEGMKEAAVTFAGRLARRIYGKRGYARTCTQGSYSQDGKTAEYSAFVGYKTGPNETTGHNVSFTVSMK